VRRVFWPVANDVDHAVFRMSRRFAIRDAQTAR
jgi:hypothetical protein